MSDRPLLPLPEARDAMLRAALRCLSEQFAEEGAWTDAGREYADDGLALAALGLTAATEALPADRRPVGWPA